VVTGAEVVSVAKAGIGVAEGVKASLARPERKWPNAREALMELFIILDDWCLSAEESNKAARAALDGQVREASPLTSADLSRDYLRSMLASGNMLREYVEHTTYDIEGVLNPPVPWLQPWRRSKRRAAARRTLRSMMRVYCPDLLGSFEEAVANRADWVAEQRKMYTTALDDHPMSIAELRTSVSRLEGTLRDLRKARYGLRRLIRESFPLRATD
jgi:hypothetical protein